MVGISPDSQESHDRFRRHFSIPFTLVSDPDKKVARLYDVARRMGLGVSRVTYLIDKAGVIRDVFHHEVRIGKHVNDVLKGLKALDREGGGNMPTPPRGMDSGSRRPE